MMGIKMITITANSYTVLAICQSLFSASYKHINIETHYNPPLFSGTRRQDQAKVCDGKPRVRGWGGQTMETLSSGLEPSSQGLAEMSQKEGRHRQLWDFSAQFKWQKVHQTQNLGCQAGPSPASGVNFRK